jgi:septum site-determining protein MinC
MLRLKLPIWSREIVRPLVTSAVRPRQPMRLRGRSFMAFSLAPELPITDWLREVDQWIRNSAGFFVGRPVVLDLAAAKLDGAALVQLVTELEGRGIRIMGIEGAEPGEFATKLPPLLKGGRPASMSEGGSGSGRAAAPKRADPTSLLIETPVRSGQSIVFPAGDVTVVGSISSAAEVIAGGSIHVYGAIRGRAMAGANGNPRARIFCSSVDAELLAIDGYYRTAEDLDASLQNRPIQAWLEGATLMVAPLA